MKTITVSIPNEYAKFFPAEYWEKYARMENPRQFTSFIFNGVRVICGLSARIGHDTVDYMVERIKSTNLDSQAKYYKERE
jgi:hypothetical protein